MSEAEIIIHERDVLRGRLERRYEWRGPEGGEVAISGGALRQLNDGRWPLNFYDFPSTLRLGPWRLRKVRDEMGFTQDVAYYVRDSHFWRSRVFYYRLSELWRAFTVRAVLTLMVWGIGYVAPHTVPSWGDVLKRRD